MRKSAPVFGKRSHDKSKDPPRLALPMSAIGMQNGTSLEGKPLPDIWLKAAMLGSLWASVEIILGSFLHNLHIPF